MAKTCDRLCFECGSPCEKCTGPSNMKGKYFCTDGDCGQWWAADAWEYWVISGNNKGV